MKISAFVDCNSESIVLRIPYEMVVDMLLLLPETEDKKELKNLLSCLVIVQLKKILI